jgi:N-acetylglucosamine kinase-like BadF-type ATPase
VTSEPTAAVLAVDGGNSKTDLALVAADGTLMATARGPGSSHQRLGLDGAIGALREGVAALRAAATAAGDGRPAAGTGPAGPRRPVALALARVGVFCLAGVDLPVDDRRVRAALRTEGLTGTLVLHNDIRAVLWAGSPARWGVAVGAGTGLNCLGVAPDGQEARFPALGLISGDWVAGGRWLGLRALGQAVRASDGRGPRTALEQAVPAYYGLPDPMAVAEAVYLGRIAERQLHRLAPTVFGAAADGDPVARALIDELAQEVVTYVAATVRRLELATLAVPVVLGGGLFRSADASFMARIRHGVLAVAPWARLSVLAAPPVLGAALLGLAELGPPPAAGERLTAALTHHTFADGAPVVRGPAASRAPLPAGEAP